jgi:hypothetical protein
MVKDSAGQVLGQFVSSSDSLSPDQFLSRIGGEGVAMTASGMFFVVAIEPAGYPADAWFIYYLTTNCTGAQYLAVVGHAPSLFTYAQVQVPPSAQQNTSPYYYGTKAYVQGATVSVAPLSYVDGDGNCNAATVGPPAPYVQVAAVVDLSTLSAGPPFSAATN